MDAASKLATATPIKHLVVIFGENISFDHYFGTYAPTGGATVNNLKTPLDPTNGFAAVTGGDLLNNNPNFTNTTNNGTTPAGGTSKAANPFLLAGPSEAATPDMGHNYRPEQQASHGGAMDLFPLYTGTPAAVPGGQNFMGNSGGVMAYFDGQTVTALWGYAQQYALNDNAWTTTFGPSTPGAINLISGQTNGFASTNKSAGQTLSSSHAVADGNGGWTLIGDADPQGDVCSTASDQMTFAGKNIGDLLNAKNISWGFFEGGFDLLMTNPNGTTGCGRQTNPRVSSFSTSEYTFPILDYIPHHQPFQYYATTANLTHARPSSATAIGSSVEDDGVTAEPANHQYDSHDFFDALKAGNFPAVSYLKAPAYQDAHAGYSDPIDEQDFIISVMNAVVESPEWASTAVVVLYDDSDGWYDHQAPPIVNPSFASGTDALNGDGTCNSGAQQTGAAPTTPLLGNDGKAAQGRCGYGTRIPLLVISPYAKKNYVDHTLVDQSAVLRFIEDNWLGGERIQPGGSFDTIAGPLSNMFTFAAPDGGI